MATTDEAARSGASTTQQHDAVPPASKEAPSTENTRSVKPPMWLHAHQKKSKQQQAAQNTKKLSVRKGPSALKKASSREGKKIEHTIEQKMEIIQHYKGLGNKGGIKEEYATRMGVSTRTITRWINNEKDVLKAKEQGRGKKKTTYHKDGLRRIKQLLQQFYEQNERLPEANKLPITASVLSNQAIKIKDNLLQLSKENKLPNPLDVEEVAAISNFTASESWSGKMARENGWNDSNVNNKMVFIVDELVEETTQGQDVGKDEAAMDNTEFIIDEERQRVEKMLTAGVGEDNDESDDEDSDDKEAVVKKEAVTDEVIHDISAQLKAIATRLMNLDCNGPFDHCANDIMDLSNEILRVNRKLKQKRTAKKQGSINKV